MIVILGCIYVDFLDGIFLGNWFGEFEANFGPLGPRTGRTADENRMITCGVLWRWRLRNVGMLNRFKNYCLLMRSD